jgi:hypothetical protein
MPISKEVLARATKLSDEQLLAMFNGHDFGGWEPQTREEIKDTLRKNGLSAYFWVSLQNKEKVLIKKGKEMEFPKVAGDPYT